MIRQEKSQQSKAAILHAALAEYGKRGYYGASLNTAFMKAGISKGKAYHYYESNDQIYLECVGACFDALLNKLQLQREEKAFNSLTLEEYFYLRWEFFEDSPVFAHIFLETVQNPPEHLREEIKIRKAQFDSFNRSVFHSQLVTLKLREGVSEEDAMAYYEFFQVVFHQRFVVEMDADNTGMKRHEQTLKKALDILLYGLVKENI